MRKTLFLTLFAIGAYLISETLPPLKQENAVAAASVVPVRKTTAENEKRFLTRSNFEDVARQIYDQAGLASLSLDFEVFRLAVIGYYTLQGEGKLSNKNLLTIIDFGKPSTEKRFFTIDLGKQKVKYHTYVAHGRNTGENLAKKFSNTPHSNQSSLGFYVTGETYVGSKGYSLRLDGMEESFNSNIRSRAVVMHAAPYATEAWIKKYGRLGRSQGCPALPPHLSREVIDTIKGQTAIFTYFPDKEYLNTSQYLKVEELFMKLDKHVVELPGRISGALSAPSEA